MKGTCKPPNADILQYGCFNSSVKASPPAPWLWLLPTSSVRIETFTVIGSGKGLRKEKVAEALTFTAEYTITGSIKDGASPLPDTKNSQSDIRPLGSLTMMEASWSVSREDGAYSTSTVGNALGFEDGSVAVFP